MRRKSVIRSMAGLNLGLAVVLLVLLSTASIPISMGQATENAYVVFSGASSDDPVNTNDPGLDKDVACTNVAIASGNKTLEVTISNAYPGYSPTIDYNMTNNSASPAKVVGFNYTVEEPLELIIEPFAIGYEIPSGATGEGSLGIQIPQEAEQGVTYKFSVTINFEGSEESPP